MSMLKQFVNRTEFSSYEDFRDHLEIRVPENFNFAYDVVDATAAAEPARRAMVWCNDAGEGRDVTFAELKAGSDRAAQIFRKHGVRKGDTVLMHMQWNGFNKSTVKKIKSGLKKKGIALCKNTGKVSAKPSKVKC